MTTYRRDIQGLRGISVLLVVLFHAELPVTGGFIGVDVFFVISGFVITGLLLRELDERDRLDLPRFYARRVRRLLPALALMLVVISALSIVLLSPFFPQPVALRTAAAATFSAGNIYLWLFGGGYFGPADEQNPFVHTWSLGVEEQFYLIFPLLIAVLWHVGRGFGSRRTVAVGMTALGLASLAISVVFTHDVGGATDAIPAGDRLAFYSPFSRAWEFAAGVLLALAMGSRRSIGHPLLSWTGLIGLGAISLVFDEATPFPGLSSALPVICAVLLMTNGSTAVRRLLETKVLVWLGDLSYSWYLWHWPLIVFAGVLAPENAQLVIVAAVVSLLPSMASYQLVENRLRAGPTTTSRSSIPVAMACIGIPALLVFGGLVGARSNWGLEERAIARGEGVLASLPCDRYGAKVDACSLPAPGESMGRLLLVGDSHSFVIAGPVVKAAHEKGYSVVSRNVSSCPFTLLDEIIPTRCTANNRDIIDFARLWRPDVVVVANRSEIYLARMGLGTEAVTPDIDEAPGGDEVERWIDGLESAVSEIATFTDDILIFATVPSFTVEEYDSSLPSIWEPDGADPQRSADELRRYREPWLAAEAEMANRLGDDVDVIDGFDLLCGDACSIRNSDGQYLYRDPSHLTDFGSSRLEPLFASALPDLKEDPER